MSNCSKPSAIITSTHLTVEELGSAEAYVLKHAQMDDFQNEVYLVKNENGLPKNSKLVPLHPYMDDSGLLRVKGRLEHSSLPEAAKHPIILAATHPIAKLIIRAEHLRVLHSGPTLTLSSLSTRFHLIGGKKTVWSVVRQCTVCRRRNSKPAGQMMGQLPQCRVVPGSVFQQVGVDYAGPFLMKLGNTRKPTMVKVYMCVFVCLAVKAVHLELVTNLTTEAFSACLRRFAAHRGLPSLIMSDHGTNFVWAD